MSSTRSPQLRLELEILSEPRSNRSVALIPVVIFALLYFSLPRVLKARKEPLVQWALPVPRVARLEQRVCLVLQEPPALKVPPVLALPEPPALARRVQPEYKVPQVQSVLLDPLEQRVLRVRRVLGVFPVQKAQRELLALPA